MCPGLLAITGEADKIWFLNFLTCRDELTKLSKLRKSSLLSIQGESKAYATQVQAWQAKFAPDVEWVDEMILQNARRILALGKEINTLDQQIATIVARSELAQTISCIPSFG